jgi:hypothetical protein
LWRCHDGLFSEVPPLASDALLTMLYPLLGITVTASLCIITEHYSQSPNFSNGPPILKVGLLFKRRIETPHDEPNNILPKYIIHKINVFFC